VVKLQSANKPLVINFLAGDKKLNPE